MPETLFTPYTKQPEKAKIKETKEKYLDFYYSKKFIKELFNTDKKTNK